ncbi:MAG: TraR/DksA family transcriptional regulator [Blastocatellia bacterium]
MSEYREIQQQLQARYDEIRQRLDRITRDVRHEGGPLAQDFAEQATELENNEVLDALDNAIRAEMEQIRTTLTRLETGDYGVCQSCAGKIPRKRLEALPHISLCVRCAENATTV